MMKVRLWKGVCCFAVAFLASAFMGGDGSITVHQHVWEEVFHIHATCTTAGVKIFACSCGEEKYELEIEKGHNFEKVEAQAPTCSAVGWEEYTVCAGCTYTTKQELPILEHEWDDGEETEWGLQYTCLHCGEMEIVGHTHVLEKEVIKEPTCAEEGERLSVCACGYEKMNTIAKLEHEIEISKGELPTCTQAGTTNGKSCVNCGEIFMEKEVVPALGHVWDDGKATADGKIYTCVRCSQTQESNQPHAHTYGDWETIENSSCEKTGKRVCFCSVCNDKKEESIPAKGHQFENGMCLTCGAEEQVEEEVSSEIESDSEEEINSEESVSSEESTSTESSSSEESREENSEESGEDSSAEEITEEVIDVTVSLLFERKAGEMEYVCIGIDGNVKDCLEIVIPDTYDGLPVTEIKKRAFYGCTRLLRVTIGANVRKIGTGAFHGANEVLEVYNRSALTSDKIEIYSKEPFTNKPFTKEFKQDSNGFITYERDGEKYLVGYIGTEKEILIPNGITAIRPLAFYGCHVEKIILPPSVTEISDVAFDGIVGSIEIIS